MCTILVSLFTHGFGSFYTDILPCYLEITFTINFQTEEMQVIIYMFIKFFTVVTKHLFFCTFFLS